MAQPRASHLIAGIALLLSGAAGATMLLSSDVTISERDRTRLDRARETHTADVDRAAMVFRTAVDRANTSLDRIYSEVIRRYDQRGDQATVDALRAELAEAMRVSSPIPDDADDAQTPSNPGHTALLQSIGETVVFANGNVTNASPLAERKYVLLYFSAGWCGPCRAFTPQLARFHREQRERGSFEVVFVSSDRSSADMQRYMQDANMAWPAIPFDRVSASRLSQTHQVRGIPRLVVMGHDGTVVLPGTGGANATLQEFSRMIGVN